MAITKNRYLDQQKTFYVSMQKCSKEIKRRFNEYFSTESKNLTFDHWLILQEIATTEGINQKRISDRLGKEVAAVCRMISRMQETGLIRKLEDNRNMRDHALALTTKGEDVLMSSQEFASKTYSNLLTGVFEQEINLVLDVLKRINMPKKN